MISSPYFSLGTPITWASLTPGWAWRNSSISRGYTFSPPRMIMSLMQVLSDGLAEQRLQALAVCVRQRGRGVGSSVHEPIVADERRGSRRAASTAQPRDLVMISSSWRPLRRAAVCQWPVDPDIGRGGSSPPERRASEKREASCTPKLALIGSCPTSYEPSRHRLGHFAAGHRGGGSRALALPRDPSAAPRHVRDRAARAPPRRRANHRDRDAPRDGHRDRGHAGLGPDREAHGRLQLTRQERSVDRQDRSAALSGGRRASARELRLRAGHPEEREGAGRPRGQAVGP